MACKHGRHTGDEIFRHFLCKRLQINSRWQLTICLRFGRSRRSNEADFSVNLGLHFRLLTSGGYYLTRVLRGGEGEFGLHDQLAIDEGARFGLCQVAQASQ